MSNKKDASIKEKKKSNYSIDNYEDKEKKQRKIKRKIVRSNVRIDGYQQCYEDVFFIKSFRVLLASLETFQAERGV